MLTSVLHSTSRLLWAIPLLVVGCLPANDASDYKTVHAYNKGTGKYFDVKVPYHTTFGPDGTISRDPPSRQEIDGAVDKATWEAGSQSGFESYLHGRSGTGVGDGRGSSTGSSRSPLDQTTTQGSSYHDAASDGPFGGDRSSHGGFPRP